MPGPLWGFWFGNRCFMGFSDRLGRNLEGEKTYLNLYFTGGAAILGIGMNWILVPSYSGMGAAIATVITYLAWILVSMMVSESLGVLPFLMARFTDHFWRSLRILVSLSITKYQFLNIDVGLIVIILQLGSAIELRKLRTLIKLLKTV